jgi:peptidyl-prolyl cis-trans isomerase C
VTLGGRLLLRSTLDNWAGYAFNSLIVLGHTLLFYRRNIGLVGLVGRGNCFMMLAVAFDKDGYVRRVLRLPKGAKGLAKDDRIAFIYFLTPMIVAVMVVVMMNSFQTRNTLNITRDDTMTIRQPLPYMLLLTTLFLGSACVHQTPISRDESKVMAAVNGEAITKEKYEHYLLYRNKNQTPLPDKTLEEKVVLGEMINRVLLVQYAVEQNVSQESDVGPELARIRNSEAALVQNRNPPNRDAQRDLTLQRENLLARAALRRHFTKYSPITDDELRKRFDQVTREADKNEYRARHILVATNEEARRIIAELNKGGDFGAIAQKESLDVGSGKKGGELGWFNQDLIVLEFFNAATVMKKGEISKEPVKSNFGWHVINLEDKRPRKMPGFDEAKNNIRQLLQQERIDALLQSLKEKAKVEIYQ